MKIESTEGVSAELNPKRVLLLDDNQLFAGQISLFLETENFDVVTVSDGVAGLREVMERDFDVIVCDLMMPRLPGDKFFLAVSRVKPHLTSRFVFITGYRLNESAVAALQADHPVVFKPFHPNELVSVMREILSAKGFS
jgi:DNA-binding response OmpR family regulator